MNIIDEIIASSIWAPTSIEETPELEMSRWHIYEVSSDKWPEKTRHFVGYNCTEGGGRVSSAIVEFDKATMKGKTQSGRVYHLNGPPGINMDAMYVWGHWTSANGINQIVDVSKEVLDV
jgi:hypothetical protein